MRLKSLRKEFNMTQVELAKALNVAQNTVCNWENGKRSLDDSTMQQIADYFGVSVDYLLGREDTPNGPPPPSTPGSEWIPVRGRVAAGTPIEMVEDIQDYEEISKEMVAKGEHIALKIKGDSMEPIICDGDVVIVRLQPDVESGKIAVVTVNGDDATVKRIKKRPEGLLLIPNNQSYDPMFYSNEDILSLPIRILGMVVELRRKF
jgi:repressor LexA